MAAEHSLQPQISKLDLVATEAKLGSSKEVEVVFKVEYELKWPSPCLQRWRLDLALFEVDSVERLEADLGDRIATSQEEWRERYLAMEHEGHRVFGPEGACSVILESVFVPWSLNKTFGAIKLFVAEHYLSVVNACTLSINNLVYQTIPDTFIEQVIGDGWTFSDYQSDKKRWWKKWRLDLEGTTAVVKSGVVTLSVPLKRLEREGEGLAFYDPEEGWQIIDEEHRFRVFGRLVEIRPRPVSAWTAQP